MNSVPVVDSEAGVTFHQHHASAPGPLDDEFPFGKQPKQHQDGMSYLKVYHLRT